MEGGLEATKWEGREILFLSAKGLAGERESWVRVTEELQLSAEQDADRKGEWGCGRCGAWKAQLFAQTSAPSPSSS